MKKKIDWSKITDNEEIIKLIKQRNEIEEKIKKLDEQVLVYYEIERLRLNE